MECYVRPNALFGAKTLSMEVAEKRLNVIEMKYLRVMCGITHMDSSHNTYTFSFNHLQ